MAVVNRTELDLEYEGNRITEKIAPYVTAFSYTDHEGGKADDLQITVEDRDGLWKKSWFPPVGALLTAHIHIWGEAGKATLSCGTFAMDEISFQGPPDTAEIKAVSSFTQKPIKREAKTRDWKNTTLETIASTVAKEYDLKFFHTGSRVTLDRMEQRQESDLAFIKRLCDDFDFNVKISHGKIILFENKAFELREPAFSIVRGGTAIGGYGFRATTQDTYKACRVSYWDAEKKEEIKHTFTPPSTPAVGQTFVVNQRMENLKMAEIKSRAMLRRKNSQEITGSFELMGDPALLAGMPGTISGFGAFDGKYIITQAVHTYGRSQGYRTQIQIRKAMTW